VVVACQAVAHIEDHIHLPLQESPAIIRLQENRILFHKFPYLTPELYCLWISGESVLHLLSQEEMDRVVHYKPRIMQQSLSSRVKNRMSMMNECHAHGSSTVQILNPFETPKL
jgi:hypothetical protein